MRLYVESIFLSWIESRIDGLRSQALRSVAGLWRKKRRKVLRAVPGLKHLIDGARNEKSMKPMIEAREVAAKSVLRGRKVEVKRSERAFSTGLR
tara:strand:- start:521 stop:802 length:282 start_codon:yes stop_codon:yes gene_type:complete